MTKLFESELFIWCYVVPACIGFIVLARSIVLDFVKDKDRIKRGIKPVLTYGDIIIAVFAPFMPVFNFFIAVYFIFDVFEDSFHRLGSKFSALMDKTVL